MGANKKLVDACDKGRERDSTPLVLGGGTRNVKNFAAGAAFTGGCSYDLDKEGGAALPAHGGTCQAWLSMGMEHGDDGFLCSFCFSALPYICHPKRHASECPSVARQCVILFESEHKVVLVNYMLMPWCWGAVCLGFLGMDLFIAL